MPNSFKRLARTPKQVTPNQHTIAGFVTPFEQSPDPENCWVVLANFIPWDEIANLYLQWLPYPKSADPI